jgi:hypothetical protein
MTWLIESLREASEKARQLPRWAVVMELAMRLGRAPTQAERDAFFAPLPSESPSSTEVSDA